MRARTRIGAVALALALAILTSASLAQRAETPAPAGASAIVERGRYLAIVGDCTSCHTKDAPFSGGYGLNTPFGTIYSANITPDAETGIGRWTSDQFYRALHEGVRVNGQHLYPAFPYTSFTKVTRADSDALYAYLGTLEPVRHRPPANRLPPVVNYRGVMVFWNALFFRKGEFRPDPARSQEWNRGAYLVEGLGHCGDCHTPRNFLGATKSGRALQGGVLEGWFAANLAGDLRDGLGGWSRGDIVEYLRTGRNGRATASGLMAQVVLNSTSKMTGADLRAITTYLQDIPPTEHVRAAPSQSQHVLALGAQVYSAHCSACHTPSAAGVSRLFPPLAGNASLQSRDPTTIVRLVLQGSRSPTLAARPTPSAMPAFDWKLNDREIAAVLTYARMEFGNSASPVSAREVARIRRAIAAAPSP